MVRYVSRSSIHKPPDLSAIFYMGLQKRFQCCDRTLSATWCAINNFFKIKRFVSILKWLQQHLRGKKNHLRGKKGPLEIFHRLNTTYLTTLQELNKHAITKNNFKRKWNWNTHKRSQYSFISHSKFCLFVFPNSRLGLRAYLNLIQLAIIQIGRQFQSWKYV